MSAYRLARALRYAPKIAGVVAVTIAAANLARPGAAVAAPRAHVSGCKPAPRPYSLASPGRALESVVAVLGEPTTDADRAFAREFLAALAANPGRFGGQITFINDFRLARVVDGRSYYVVPVIRVSCDGSEGPESIAVMDGGSGYCCDTAPAIAQGEAVQSFRPGTGPVNAATTFVTLVPNGVASATIDLPARVTSHYPRLPDGKLEQQHNKAYTTTTRIVGNLLVVTLPGAPGRFDHPLTLQWRSASGHVLRTFSRL
jgi:hypothetical protein